MKVDSMWKTFLRSNEKFGVMYSKYIGDGDFRTFLGILNSDLYGNKCTVIKNDCVGQL